MVSDEPNQASIFDLRRPWRGWLARFIVVALLSFRQIYNSNYFLSNYYVFVRHYRCSSWNRGRWSLLRIFYANFLKLATQFEFVRQFALKSENTVFALVRSRDNDRKLVEMGAKNVHILEADITDVKALKVIPVHHSIWRLLWPELSLQIAAAKVKTVTGGSLDYLINNAAFVDATRKSNNLDG